MTPSPRRSARPSSTATLPAVAVIAVVALAGLLSGCAGPGADVGARVAEWVEEQDHVLSATSWVSDDPWNKAITIDMVLEPDIGDAELIDVTTAAERRARESGWEHPLVGATVGEGESYSNLGGRVTLDVFLALRDDPRYPVLSARGEGGCGGFFCVELPSSDPAELLAAVKQMLAAADEAGGVQTNLTFTATTPDDLLAVTAQPLAPIDDSVALLEHLSAQQVPILSARAWPVEPVGDLAPLQLLDITVPDAAAVALAESLAAAYPTVELRSRPAP
jgi:hypothetical protein